MNDILLVFAVVGISFAWGLVIGYAIWGSRGHGR